MRVTITVRDERGVIPLDDCEWSLIQLASFLHGRDVTDQEYHAAYNEVADYESVKLRNGG